MGTPTNDPAQLLANLLQVCLICCRYGGDFERMGQRPGPQRPLPAFRSAAQVSTAPIAASGFVHSSAALPARIL